MTEKDIREGIKFLHLDESDNRKCEDIFKAYRNFSAYQPAPSINSTGTSLPRLRSNSDDCMPRGAY
jgi:hypothetical protein